MFWFILFRNGSRELTDMIVAWLEESRAEAEIDAYIAWDRRDSEATSWELVRIPRQERESYFKVKKKKNDPDDVLEYHWVWDDYEDAEETVVRTV